MDTTVYIIGGIELTILLSEIKDHVGHELQCSSYGNGDNYTIECVTCATILFEWDKHFDEDGEYETDDPMVFSLDLATKQGINEEEGRMLGAILGIIAVTGASERISLERQMVVLDHAMKVLDFVAKMDKEKAKEFATKYKRKRMKDFFGDGFFG